MKYIKKPIGIEAVKYEGRSNIDEVLNFMGVKERYAEPVLTDAIIIRTLEGDMRANPGDYIIKGINGEFYPCKPDIFKKTYQQGGIEKISDGYHTFDELYDHRITLFIALCRWFKTAYNLSGAANNPIWKSKRHSDGEVCFGTGTQFVMGLGTSKGNQITYHIPIDRWEETNFAETLEKAPEWDGHTPEDVLKRLKKL